MGNYLNDTEHKAIHALEHNEGSRLPLVPWLDEVTALYLRALVAYIADDIPTALAVILYYRANGMMPVRTSVCSSGALANGVLASAASTVRGVIPLES
jgi:hypothetical protein